MNIFIAILCDAYNKAKFSEEDDEEKEEEEEEEEGESKSSDGGFQKTVEKYVKGFLWKLRIAFYAYFGLADDLEKYYVKKFAKENDRIGKNNFLFDYGMLIDWSLDDKDHDGELSHFNGDDLWYCILNCGDKLSKFVI